MSMVSRAVQVGAILIACLGSGCAFVDQKVPLAYQAPKASVQSSQGGNVSVEMPVCPEFGKNKKGLCIIGNVKNTYGMKTADTVTADSVPKWIADAFSTELQAAGFTPEIVDQLPSTAARGVSTRVIKVWVEQDPGFWTVGAIGEVQMRITLYRAGRVVKTFDVESKGQGNRSMVGDAATKQESLRIALATCMKETIPIMVESFKE